MAFLAGSQEDEDEKEKFRKAFEEGKTILFGDFSRQRRIAENRLKMIKRFNEIHEELIEKNPDLLDEEE